MSEEATEGGTKENLESRILEITHDPVDYHQYSHYLDWCGDEKAVEAVLEIIAPSSNKAYAEDGESKNILPSS